MARRIIYLLLTLISSLSGGARAQNLTNGDLAIVNFATASNGVVGMVALTNLPALAVVNLTVASWSNGFDSAATYSWTLPASGVPAGAFVTLTNFNNAALSISTGSIALGPIQMALSTNGDQILVFQTSSTNHWFVYGLNYNVAWITNGPIGPSASYLPPGLDGASLELLAVTNGAYNRVITNGTKAELLAAITNASNWIRSSDSFPFTNAPMTVTNPFVIQVTFATNSGAATESDRFSVEIQRNVASGTGVAEVAFGGSATRGTDYEVYAITHIRNPSLGSGGLGLSLASWGTNLFASGSSFSDYGGDVVLFDSTGRELGVITNPAPDAPGGGNTAERFGSSIAFMSSNLVIVGAEGDNVISNDAGAAHLFSWNGSNATFLATITDPNPSFRDYFGCAVARLDSNRFIVGAFNSDLAVADSGSAYIYSWNGVSATRVASVTNPTAAFGDVFGRSIAVLKTNRFVIGNEYFDIGTNVNVGSAYLYEWNGGAATLLATITNPAPGRTDQFGHSVAALSSNQFLIGADLDDISSVASNAGRVFAYDWNGTNAVLLAVITNPVTAPEVNFGYTLAALSTNRFVVGAWRSDLAASNAGAAFLYDWNGSAATLLATVTNPAPEMDDLFGNAVLGAGSDRFLVAALEDDGLTTDDGSVTLYAWNGASAVVVTTLTHVATASDDSFATSLDGMANGRFVIGAPYDNGGGYYSGAAHLFQWTGTSAEHLATVANPGQLGSTFFGSAVGGMGDSRFVVGAQFEGSEGLGVGRAYLYEWDGTNAGLLATVTNPNPSTYAYFGSAVSAVGSSRFLVAAVNGDEGATDAGTVYLYGWNGTNATVLATVTNPTPAMSEAFGSSLAGMGPFRFLVGAELADQNGVAAGCAYLYQWNGSVVTLLATVTNPAPQNGDTFGSAVSGLSVSRFLVGAESDSGSGAFSGQAYLYEWNGATATLLATVTNPTPSSADLFGSALAGISTNRFAVGAYQEGPNGTVYLYNWDGQAVSLLTTITNPATQPGRIEDFGAALAVANEVGLLVGVPGDSDPGISSGSAWLYRTALAGQNLVVDFEDGETSAYVHVFAIDDRQPEDPETITFTLASNLGITPFGITSTVYVVNDNDPWANAITRPFLLSPTTAAITWTDTVAGTSYQLETTTNLLNTTWTTSTLFNATGSAHTVSFPFATNEPIQAFRLTW